MNNFDSPTVPINKDVRASIALYTPRKPYVPGVREPYHLPDTEIHLPAPERIEGSPPKFNLISLLPPLAMMGVAFFMRQSNSNPLMFVMYGASAISPIVGAISVIFQKKAYKRKLEKREQDYRIR